MSEVVSAEFLLSALNQSATWVKIETMGVSKITNKWSIAPRSLPHHLIYFLERGSVYYDLSGEKGLLEKNNVLWLQPDVKHHFWSNETEEDTVIYFVRFYLKQKDYFRLSSDKIFLSDFNFIKWHFSELVQSRFNHDELKLFHQKALLTLLICDILSQFEMQPSKQDGLNSYQKRQVLLYINEHITKRFNTKDLAKVVRLNSDYFSRLFKKTFSESPREFISRCRVHASEVFLTDSNMNISEVADHFGYTDIYQFSQQFKKYKKMSPQNYRKLMNGE